MALQDSLKQLQNFDLADLDVNNVGSWPGAVKGIVMFLVLAAVIGAGYYLHLTDKRAMLERVQLQEKDLRAEYEDKSFQAANLEIYRQQKVEMEKTFGTLLRRLPGDTEVPGLLEDILLETLAAPTRVHRLRARLDDVQFIRDAVLGPLDVHGLAVVLLYRAGPGCELDYLFVIEHEPLPVALGHLGIFHARALRGVHELDVLAAELLLDDGVLELAATRYSKVGVDFRGAAGQINRRDGKALHRQHDGVDGIPVHLLRTGRTGLQVALQDWLQRQPRLTCKTRTSSARRSI